MDEDRAASVLQRRFRSHHSFRMHALARESQFVSMLKEKYPSINTAEHFRALRDEVRAVGVRNFYSGLEGTGITSNGKLRAYNISGKINIFAGMTQKTVSLKDMGNKQALLGDDATEFIVAGNIPENDERWEDGSEEWLGKASMAQRHKFMLVRSPAWYLFNAISIGIAGDLSAKYPHASLEEGISTLERLRAAANQYMEADGWSGNTGLFVHVYPYASVPCLHVHMVDLDVTGPTFAHLNFKNLPLDAVIDVLISERDSCVAEASRGLESGGDGDGDEPRGGSCCSWLSPSPAEANE